MDSRKGDFLKTRIKNTNFIYVFSICFIFTLFVNCAGMDAPLEYASQTGSEQRTNTTGNHTNNTPLGETYNNYNNIIFNQRNENTPNMKHIIDQLAEQCPVIMQSVWSESRQSWSGDLRFLDLAVEALQAEDQRWGYTFWTRTGYADSWSADRVGYFHGTGDPNNSTDMTVIDYLAPRQENGRWVYYPSWYNATQQLKTEYPDATGYWRQSRPGATVSLSDCSGNTDGGTEPPTTQLGQCDIPNHFSIVQKVARDYPELLAKSNNKDAKNWEFLEKLVEELRKADTKWGFYHRTQHNLQEASLDAVAYYCGTGNGNGSSDLRFVDVITSSLRASWQDNKEKHAARARPENGYWKYPRIGTIPSTTTTTTTTTTTGDGSQCTQEQINNGYGTHPQKNQCLPRCISFSNSNAEGVEIAEGNNCNDNANYNILEIQNTFEDNKCCRKSSKRSCPAGYELHNGNCYPTCQQAAKLAGYTNLAGHNRVGNYVLHEKQTFANDANCRELDEYGPNGYNDWKDFHFYDPYTFRNLRNDNNTISEIILDSRDDYLCCVRGNPNTTPAHSL